MAVRIRLLDVRGLLDFFVHSRREYRVHLSQMDPAARCLS
jgi:hypothetical protein